MALFDSVPFLQEAVLFLLVFVVVFAILQKSKILGDSVSKLNSLTALAFALIFVGVASTLDIITKMIPFIAVALVVILMFLLLWGFVGGDIGGLPKEIKNTIIILSAIFLVVVIVYITGLWTKIRSGNLFNSGVLYSILGLAAVIGTVIYVISSSKTD